MPKKTTTPQSIDHIKVDFLDGVEVGFCHEDYLALDAILHAPGRKEDHGYGPNVITTGTPTRRNKVHVDLDKVVNLVQRGHLTVVSGSLKKPGPLAVNFTVRGICQLNRYYSQHVRNK